MVYQNIQMLGFYTNCSYQCIYMIEWQRLSFEHFLHTFIDGATCSNVNYTICDCHVVQTKHIQLNDLTDMFEQFVFAFKQLKINI